jgi:hypothetical protein
MARLMTNFYEAFAAFARSEYACLQPGTTSIPAALVSPHSVRISRTNLQIMQAAVTAFFRLRQLPAYLSAVAPSLGALATHEPGNFSVLMSYDFHVTETGPRLIEINTNAGFALGAELVDRFHAPAAARSPRVRERIVETFWEDWRSARPHGAPRPATIAIVDEDFATQNFYVEFLMFRELFEAAGVRAHIAAPEDFTFDVHQRRLCTRTGEVIDFVYNRSTDFFLDKASHAALRDAYMANAIVLSPNPREYALLADKQRLIDWSASDLLARSALDESSQAALRAVLEPTRDLTSYASPDEAWHARKGLFFKPKHAYGGKAVYKGASLSQGKFREIVQSGDYVVQTYIPAGHVVASDGEEFKYDVRCYAYRDEVLLASARLYQGQVTNFRSPNGGFGALTVLD